MKEIIFDVPWGSTDWILAGLAAGFLGSYYMSKNLLFVRHFRERALSYFGPNPYEIKVGILSRVESAYGFILLSGGYMCQIIGVWWAYEGENWKSVILTNWTISLVLFLLLILLNSGIIGFVRYVVATRRFRSETARERIGRLEDLIDNVQNNYLRKDIRGKVTEESEVERHRNAGREEVESFIKEMSNLLDMDIRGDGDLDKLQYIKCRFQTWNKG